MGRHHRMATMTDLLALDPPDYELRATVRRLGGVWREQWKLTAVGLAYAFAYSALSLVIPILVARAIDGVDRRTTSARCGRSWSRSPCWRSSAPGSTSCAATPRRGSASGSRRGCASCSTPPTCASRARSTTCTRPARSSRARRTTSTRSATSSAGDWSRARRALMMLVGAGIVLVAVNPALALWSALPLPLIALVAWRFAHRVMPISRAGPAAQGRRHRVGERGRRRDRDGAGVRPRGRRAGPLRRARGRGPHRGAAAGAASSPSTCPASSTCRRCRSSSVLSSAAAR